MLEKSNQNPLGGATPAGLPGPVGTNEAVSVLDVLAALVERWRLLTVAPIAAGVLAFGATYLLPPQYTARTSFFPPQQQQSATASAIASLGALSGLMGSGLTGMRNSGDQYVSLMQSVQVQDRIIERFKLMEQYNVRYKQDARRELTENVRILLGKKDGLITVEVEADDPQMAADIANEHVSELRRVSAGLALTEAQQRRVFFETELKNARSKLVEAQTSLQNSGFNPGALKAEPKAAAEGFAALKAALTTAEVKLQTLRRRLTESSPEVQQQLAQVGALRSQLARIESADKGEDGADYIGRYRDYKYHETMFELFAKQYELARLDEARENALIQVVDVATAPERHSKPKRATIAVLAGAASFFLTALWVLVSGAWRQAGASPTQSHRLARLKAALHRK